MAYEFMFLRRRLFYGAPLVFFGLLIISTGVVIHQLGMQKVEDNIVSKLVVDQDSPEEDPNWDEWLTNDYQDAPELTVSYIMWNLTNPVEVQTQGAVPIFDPVGPYVYRKYLTKLNVTFFDNDDKMSYSQYVRLFFQRDLTDAAWDPYTDIVYSYNMGYAGIVQKAGSESAFLQSVMAPTLGGLVTLLTQTYTQNLIDLELPGYLLDTEQDLIDSIQDTDNTNVNNATKTFYITWANATSDPVYPGFNSTFRLSVYGAPSTVSLDSCQELWDVTTRFSLVNPTDDSCYLWFDAEIGEPGAQTALKTAFELTQAELDLILDWRSRVKPLYDAPIAATYGVNSTIYIGYRQWGMGDVTENLLDYFPLLALPTTPEFAFWAEDHGYPERFDEYQSQWLLSGPYGLTETEYLSQFCNLVEAGNWTAIDEMWYINETEAQRLYEYLDEVILDAYVIELVEIFQNQGSVIILPLTVDDWLWHFSDPMVGLAGTSTVLVHNDTSEEEALETKVPDVYGTGRHDRNNIGQYYAYKGMDEITMWPDHVEVEGHNGAQFEPGAIPDKDEFTNWGKELYRTIKLYYDKPVDHYGLTLYRYFAEVPDTNANFYNTWIPGIYNITQAYIANVLISYPNFYGMDSIWREKIVGLGTPSKENDVPYWKLEKYTGLAMSLRNRRLVNLYVGVGQYDVFTPNITSDVIVPVYSYEEATEIDQSQADWFLDHIYDPIYIIRIILIVACTVGSFMVVAGCVLFGLDFWRQRRMRQYQLIL